jgi:hypothetical protein
VAYGCAVRLFKEAEQAARKEKREVTPEEIQAVSAACYGVVPPSISEGAPPMLEFKLIEIEGDRAIVQYDDGAALLEAILVRENGR